MRMLNPPHPGEILSKSWLEPMGISITDAAAWLKLSRKTLSEILNGRASVTLETAVRLELATGASVQSWLGHQAAFDDWHAGDLRKKFAIRSWSAALEHRALVEADFSSFMGKHGLRALWHQGDMLLRMQSAKGGDHPAVIVINYPDEFWLAHDASDKETQEDARAGVMMHADLTYDPKSMAQFAQQVTADANSILEKGSVK